MVSPRIGITRRLSKSRPADELPPYYHRYHQRVREAGGEPVDLHQALKANDAELLDGLDVSLIPGSADLNPARYGQASHPETAGIDDAHDELEIGLIRAAMERDLPVFAISRGHQTLNVACGGPLL